MKTKFLPLVLLAGALFAFNFNTLADDGGTNCDCQDECNINGQETMDAVIVLTATDNAPANASGIAKIESENNDGNETATVELTTFGLDAGTYDLSITLQSTGDNVDLGQFTVGSDGEGDDGEDWQGDHQDSFRLDWQGGGIGCNWGGFMNWGSWTNWCDTNFFSGGWADCTNGWTDPNPCPGPNGPFISKTDVTLPADVNPTDIGQITVSDANGNAVLIGDLTTPAPASVINISATVQVTAGSAAPYANGTAHLQSIAAKGKWKHQFTLAASGMNAKSTYKLNVNGKVSGGARSSKTGQVTVKKLPSHIPALRSLRLLDSRGNEAASAKF